MRSKLYFIVISIIIIISITIYYVKNLDANAGIVVKPQLDVTNNKSTIVDYLESITKNGKVSQNIQRQHENTLKQILTENLSQDKIVQQVLNKYHTLKAKFIKSNDPNIRDEENTTILMYAVFAQDYDFIDQLITLGADVNAIGQFGATALFMSALKKDLEMMKKLVDYGAEINLEGSTSPLFTTLRLNTKEMTKYLVKNGANLEAKSPNRERTPIYEAIKYTDIDSIKYLIDNGANTNAKDQIGRTPLLEATMSGDIKKVKLLESLSNSDLSDTDSRGFNAIMSASGYGDKELIDYLLINKGLNVNMSDVNGQTALLNAVARFNKETTKALIDNGINIHAKMLNANVNALHASIGMLPYNPEYEDKEIEMAKILLHNNMNINDQGNNGHTPLSIAIVKGKTKLAEFLIQQGADFNLKGENGLYPLDYAIEKRDEKIIKLLNHKAATSSK